MIYGVLACSQSFSGGSDGKESACNVRDLGSIPGLGRSPGGGHGNPLQYSCLENPPGQPAGLQSMGHKELDMTEQLSTAHALTAHSVMDKPWVWGRATGEIFY